MEPVRSRMDRLAQAKRFEEAALVRDRWASLRRAIQRNRIWHALQNAGLVEASGPEGASVLIEHGRMVASWPTTGVRPLLVLSATNDAIHPPSMAAIDEALLLWKWLTRSSVQIVSLEGSLALPAWEIPDLTSRQATRVPGGTERSGTSSTTPSSVSPPMTRTSERKPPTLIGSNPVTATT